MAAAGSRKRLSESVEMYLKTILNLERRHEVVRVRDIAESLDITTASASLAMKKLREKALIVHDDYEHVKLTDAGRKHARVLHHKCEMLGKFFIEFLGVEEGVAKSDACFMEHAVSSETIDRLVQFMSHVESNRSRCARCLPTYKTFLRKPAQTPKSAR